MTTAADSKPSLDRFRSYLLLVARIGWRPRLAGKLDPSDVVQQTLLQAWQGLPAYRGTSDGELAAWLRQILTRNLANVARDYGRDKRDVSREQSLDAAVADSSARLEAWLDGQQSSPSQQAERNEQLLHWPTPWPPCRRHSKRRSPCITCMAWRWTRSPSNWTARQPRWRACSNADFAPYAPSFLENSHESPGRPSFRRSARPRR